MADSNLGKLIETAIENIKNLTDVNTIIGEPVSVSGGTTIIPVSKISMGFTSGGIDYTSKRAPEKTPNFGGGTGSGFTILPVAFLVIDQSGEVKLISVESSAGAGNRDLLGTISEIVDKAPTLIEKITNIFKTDSKSKEKDDSADNTPKSSKNNSSQTSTVLNNADIDDMKIE